MGRKLGAPPPFREGAGSLSNTMSLELRPTTSLPSGMIHPAICPNRYGSEIGEILPLLGEEEMGPHITQCRLAEAYLPTKWHLDPSIYLDTAEMVRKLGALPPFGGGGDGSPSNTMSLSLGLQPTSYQVAC